MSVWYCTSYTHVHTFMTSCWSTLGRQEDELPCPGEDRPCISRVVVLEQHQSHPKAFYITHSSCCCCTGHGGKDIHFFAALRKKRILKGFEHSSLNSSLELRGFGWIMPSASRCWVPWGSRRTGDLRLCHKLFSWCPKSTAKKSPSACGCFTVSAHG